MGLFNALRKAAAAGRNRQIEAEFGQAPKPQRDVDRDEYAGLPVDIQPRVDEWTLEDEVAVSPHNLTHLNWCELADQRGVPLDEVDEYMAMPAKLRPLSPEAEHAQDAREEAYIERQLAEAYEADAQVEPEAQAGFEALENHPKRDYGNRFAGFEFEGQQLYARYDRGGDGCQILTPEEAEAELSEERESDTERALLQAIEDDASYEADYAMPRPPANSHELGGAYYAEWDRAERIAGDRYVERIAELERAHGLAPGSVAAEKQRQVELAEQRYEERRAEHERERGIEICPF